MSDFMDLPQEYCRKDASAVVLIPVPFEGKVSYGKGASRGPSAILSASRELEFFDIETDSEPYLAGIFTDRAVEAADSAEIIDRVCERLSKHEDKFPIVLGGDHSVSIGAIKHFSRRCKGLTVLHLDAHLDLRDEFHEDKNNHACVMRRASEFGVNIVHVGIRSMDIEEKDFLRSSGHHVFYAPDLPIQDIIKRLGKEVYISIDLDVFDPSVMPSTGTPEPGGLGWYEVTSLIKAVFEKRDVVGADIVELAPIEGLSHPDFTAAKLAYKMIAYRYGKKPRR